MLYTLDNQNNQLIDELIGIIEEINDPEISKVN